MSNLDPMAFLRKLTVLATWKRLDPPGSSPGTLVTDTALPAPVVSLLSYDEEEVVDQVDIPLSEAMAEIGKRRVAWIDIRGLGNVEVLKELGQSMDLHPLELEDVLDFSQRIKIQVHDNYSFFIGKHIQFKSELIVQQISVFFTSQAVVTLTPVDSSFLDPVRARIRKKTGQIRRASSEYLTYAIVDTLVDSAFPVIDRMGDLVDDMELEVFGQSRGEDDVATTIRE
ncbi:MAG: hypothetical protein KDD35_11680, partial [Bdellovibrionales bacterium]|nr:hypothetical protein [Bdellovibrionales bacterium]